MKESILRKAIADLDWQQLEKYLDHEMSDSDALGILLIQIRQSSSLLIKHHDKGKRKKRDKFLGSLADYCEKKLGSEGRKQLLREVTLIDNIEKGYHLILDSLSESDISRLSPERRVSAYIGRAAHQYSLLMKRLTDEVATREEIAYPSGPLLTGEENLPIAPDGVVYMIARVLTNSVQMEAHRNSWFDEEDNIVIPSIVPTQDEDIEKAGSNELWAISWYWWQKAEQRYRFMGGEMEVLTHPNLPTWAPEDAKGITSFKAPNGDFFDYASNIRLNNRIVQSFQEMHLRSRKEAFNKEVKDGSTLLPNSFVSLDEANSALILTDILGFNILLDDTLVANARIAEWLRGYAILQNLARERTNKNDSDSLIIALSSDELADIFSMNGIGDESIPVILRALTLRKQSRDLFDSPLLRVRDGTMLLFSPCVITANLTRIVLSTLSEQGASLGKKGKAFEQSTLSFLQSQNLWAKSFKINLDEEFEYDVLLLWDTHLFIFECKNHSLSSRSPIHAYRIMEELQSNVKQVKRLEEGMRKHSEEIGRRLQVNIKGKKIVPCVLNSLPYSLPGNFSGVYITDASALHRFFNERYLHASVPYKIDEKTTVLYRVALQSLWAGEKPTPEDLVRFLEKPIPLEFVKAHSENRIVPIPLGRGEYAFVSDYHMHETTIDSMAKFTGTSATAIRDEIDEFLKQAKRAKNKYSKKSD